MVDLTLRRRLRGGSGVWRSLGEEDRRVDGVRRGSVPRQVRRLAVRGAFLPRSESSALLGPALLPRARRRHHPVPARSRARRVHRRHQGQALLAAGCPARSGLRAPEPGDRHLHDVLRRPRESGAVSGPDLLSRARADRHLQPPDARRRATDPGGPPGLDRHARLPAPQPAHGQSGRILAARRFLLRAADRRLRHRLHPAVQPQAGPAVRPGRAILADPVRLAGRPRRPASARVRWITLQATGSHVQGGLDPLIEVRERTGNPPKSPSAERQLP